jgi:exopolyphosphatase/pppGpp-phosphohydrolase
VDIGGGSTEFIAGTDVEGVTRWTWAASALTEVLRATTPARG